MTGAAGVLVLASGSRARREMLERAGVRLQVASPEIDERALSAPLEAQGAAPAELALALGEAKAKAVSQRLPGRWVLGGDQTLALGDRILHKPADLASGRRQLLALSGATHFLHSSAVLALDGETAWRHVETAAMTMRRLDPAFVDRYLAAAGPDVLSSVGVYQIESLGANLFEHVAGDLWTVIGLPLMPVLAALRERGLTDA